MAILGEVGKTPDYPIDIRSARRVMIVIEQRPKIDGYTLAVRINTGSEDRFLVHQFDTYSEAHTARKLIEKIAKELL